MEQDPTQTPPTHGVNPLHPSHLPPAPGWPIHPVMITTGLELPGFRILRVHGIVRGLVVRSAGFGGGIAASFEALGGGNVKTMANVCERAREEAFYLMLQHAAQLSANAIVGFRYDTTEVGQGLTEVLAYGTAVWVETVAA
ncbi:MAG TPA: YbjQ family protein [Pyrinomonadaceae bacterium]|nr:YbjQ family protein [Pyrinomonadaceae bacterium]